MKQQINPLSYRHLRSPWIKLGDNPMLLFLLPLSIVIFGAILYWLATVWAAWEAVFLPLTIFGTLLCFISFVLFIEWYKKRAIKAFAQENGLGSIHPHDLLSLVPASIRHRGHRRTALNGYLFHVSNRPVAIFDYAFTEGSGKSSRTYSFGLLVFILKKDYPHLFLDGRVNGISPAYHKSQRISLEGDFDKYFHLYAPQHGHIAGLSILAPDMMQALVDSGRPYDVEIENRQVSFITPHSLYEAKALQHALEFLDKFTDEIDHKEMTWSPVYHANGRPMKLQKRSYTKFIVIVLGIAILMQIVLQLFFYLYSV